MFIPRIWFDEVERIGKQRCTPVGYALQTFGDIVGLIGLLLLLGVPLYLAYTAISGTFRAQLLWLLLAPIGFGVAGSIIVSVSWVLAQKKQFRYDYETRVSRWVEDGQERAYTIEDLEAERR